MKVHNGRAMNTQERVRIQPVLQAPNRLAQQVRLLASADPYVVLLSLDPPYVIHRKKQDPPTRLENHPRGIPLLLRFLLLGCSSLSRFTRREPLTHALDRRMKSLRRKRLKQIIDCMYFKSPNSIPVVRRYKNYMRQC